MFSKTYMFHRFKDKHGLETGQGSFSGDELEHFILKNGPENFVTIEDIKSFKADNNFKTKRICLTFDDGLLSQFRIAKPILDKHGIKGFWFIYTKLLEGQAETTEILSYIVSRFYRSFDQFYNQFEKHLPPGRVDWLCPDFLSYNKKLGSLFSFYTIADKKFRFLRDVILSSEEFDKIVYRLVQDRGLDYKKLSEEIWMSKSDINQLSKDGHEVGLHSHTHPHKMEKLNYNAQAEEYERNFKLLRKITNQNPFTVAHPLGSYNRDTLVILSNLRIQIGFRSNPKNIFIGSSAKEKMLQLPRIDANAITV